jgi:hypothetical protein
MPIFNVAVMDTVRKTTQVEAADEDEARHIVEAADDDDLSWSIDGDYCEWEVVNVSQVEQ